MLGFDFVCGFRVDAALRIETLSWAKVLRAYYSYNSPSNHQVIPGPNLNQKKPEA